MKRKFRNTTAILLAGLFLYNSLGYFFVYSTMRMMHRQMVFAQLSTIPDSQLTTVTILKAEREQDYPYGDKNEIKINGQLFDVIKQKDNGKSITYYCKRDRKEELLNTNVANIVHHTGTEIPLSKSAQLILDNIIKNALISSEDNQLSQLFIGLNPIVFSSIYKVPLIPVPAPPPQQAC